MDTEDLSKFILESLEKGKKDSLDANNDNQNTDNDSPFSTENMKIDQQIILGVLKSLTSHDIINFNVVEKESWNLTLEGNDILSLGSHEVRVFNMISMQKSIQEINDALGEYAKIGQSKAFKNKWIRQVPLEEEKGSNGGYRLEGCVQSVQDETREQLIKISKGEMVDSSIIQDLKRRKLIILEKNQHFLVTKGKSFSLNIQKQATDLTCEMIKTGSWMSEQFKKYNYNACGSNIPSGNLHPLLKVREEFRQIFLQMGFEEMPTNRFVESSFWNFDALFQPQQHPARDAHDTFFLKNPEFANSLPKDYMRATREIHENGGFGSTGYQCKWEEKEALKNIMRTHTTAISSQMLYNLAKESVFKPAKYFSIDRVYRNETLDATHLAEFHQIEGLIVDHDLTLGDLIGTLKAFFSRLGIEKLRFKPAYNPYTEPSMEIFAYHPGLKRWIELGNSGIFRPEMLRPMGFDERVRVIAWGLSLERPTMIKYGLSNIRELVGHKVDLAIVRSNPICRLEK